MEENPHWKNFFNAFDQLTLCQADTKHQEPLLDSEYKIKVETAATIAASDSVGLMSDGWSSIRNEPITNFVVSQPKPIF